MISFRVKYWLLLCGAEAVLTLLFAAAGRVGFVIFGFLMTFFSYKMAEYLEEKDAEEFIRKIEGGKDENI